MGAKKMSSTWKEVLLAAQAAGFDAFYKGRGRVKIKTIADALASEEKSTREKSHCLPRFEWNWSPPVATDVDIDKLGGHRTRFVFFTRAKFPTSWDRVMEDGS